MTAIALKPAKRQPGGGTETFLDRLEKHQRLDLNDALTAYRALAFAVARDPRYDADPQHVEEILDTLGLTARDLQADVEAIQTVEALDQQFAAVDVEAMRVRRSRAEAELLAARAAIPKAQGELAHISGVFMARAHTERDAGLKRTATWRMYAADAAERLANRPQKPPAAVGVFYY